MNVMQGSFRQGLTAGGWPILISAVLFLVLGSFFGQLGVVGQFWPLLLVLAGVLILLQGFWRRA